MESDNKETFTDRIGRVGVVMFSHYPSDPRPAREAEALQRAGLQVSIICLRDRGQPRRETVNGIELHRLDVTHARRGRIRYLMEYGLFLAGAFARVTALELRHHFDLIHVHNMPDVLVFTTLIPRLLGARLILDLHDPMPEVYMTKFSLPRTHVAIRILTLLERLSVAWADRVITPNRSFRRLFMSRSCPPGKIATVMNSPDERIFRNGSVHANGNGFGQERGHGFRAAAQDSFVLMYHGLIVRRHGLDVALEALREVAGEFPQVRLEIYGDGDYSGRVECLVQEMHLEERVRYHGHVPLASIPARIRQAHLGIIPNRDSPFTNLNMPTRIFEYLSLGRPVIAPRTRGVRDYFSEESIFYFRAGDAHDLARVMRQVINDPRGRRRVTQRGIQVYRNHTWEKERQTFLRLVAELLPQGTYLRQAPVEPQLKEQASERAEAAQLHSDQ